jgi:hypothetical protein
MKKFMLIVMALGLVLTVTACGDKKDKSRSLRRGGGPGTGQVPPQYLDRGGQTTAFGPACTQIPANIDLNGILINQNQSLFESELNAFLSAISSNPKDCEAEDALCLQQVSSRCEGTTGVRFASKLQASQPVRAGQPMNAQVLAGGQMHMIIFDQLAYDTKDKPEGQRVPGIGVTFTVDPSSRIQGQSVNLLLTWECGTLQYNGLVAAQSQFVEGELTFNNNSNSSRCRDSRSGTLGRLSVPLCHPQFGLFTNCG